MYKSISLLVSMGSTVGKGYVRLVFALVLLKGPLLGSRLTLPRGDPCGGFVDGIGDVSG